jgi:succinate dehydrogenase / fumarate reductase membrane anchor subunit
MRLKWDEKGIKTPQARARGLGSAKQGSTEWFNQRLTAISNLVLVIWFLFSLTKVNFSEYETFVNWVSSPVHAILLITLALSSIYHGMLGAKVITEDYIHNEGFKFFKLISQKLLFIFMAIICVYSVVLVALS